MAAILSAAMMFKRLEEKHHDRTATDVGLRIERAPMAVLALRKVRTTDVGGRRSTAEVEDAVAQEMRKGEVKR